MSGDNPGDLFFVNEVELVYPNKYKIHERPIIDSSDKAYELFLKTWNLNKIDLVEEFKIMLLDRNNQCLGISTISMGGCGSCIVEPKILFAIAIKIMASRIVLAHNHPSGILSPSEDDFKLTEQLCKGARLLGMDVVEHLIVQKEDYFSWVNEGLSLK